MRSTENEKFSRRKFPRKKEGSSWAELFRDAPTPSLKGRSAITGGGRHFQTAHACEKNPRTSLPSLQRRTSGRAIPSSEHVISGVWARGLIRSVWLGLLASLARRPPPFGKWRVRRGPSGHINGGGLETWVSGVRSAHSRRGRFLSQSLAGDEREAHPVSDSYLQSREALIYPCWAGKVSRVSRSFCRGRGRRTVPRWWKWGMLGLPSNSWLFLNSLGRSLTDV